MIKLKSFFFFIILISFLGRADSETLNFLNLSEIINEAKLNNPEIQAAKEKYEAVIQRTSPFRYLMDPWLGIEFEGDMRMYSLTQELPFPTKLSTKSKLAKIGAAKAFEEYQEKEQAIIKRVRKFYARLFLVDKEIMVMREVRDFLNQILQVAMRNYALNKIPQSDMLRTQVELARIDNELLALQDEKSVMISELYFLLNRQNDSVFGTIKEIEIKDTNFEIEKLYELAKEHRPELKLFSFGINQAKTSLSLSKQEYLPDFMVKLQQKEIAA
ncbi:MAG: TolC family protein, partial [candidate division WOR-3 bacterium]|nr:TolC family protein [candidate division WOR-3 bacterium]